MKNLFLINLVGFLLSSCVLNMSQVHTEGEASDVIDETSTNTTDVPTSVNVPLPKVPVKV